MTRNASPRRTDTEKMLASLSYASDETEFYAPMPAGYKPGKTKYVIVFGTVMSGLGKGIFSSSLAKCLQGQGPDRRARSSSRATSTSTPAR